MTSKATMGQFSVHGGMSHILNPLVYLTLDAESDGGEGESGGLLHS